MHPLIDILNNETPLDGVNAWRRAVLERDKFLCQICLSSEDVEAHHIIPKYLTPGFPTSPSNGISLCRDHHGCFHARHFTKLRAGGKGRLPYGYRREDGILIEIPDQIATVQRIQSLRREGKSYGTIASILDSKNIPAKLGGKWSRESIKTLSKRGEQP